MKNEDLAMLIQTTVQDRIIEVVRRVGGKTASSLTGIDKTPIGEPNWLRDALAAVLPARVIVTGTLERRVTAHRAPRPPGMDGSRPVGPASPQQVVAALGACGH
jgi:hypothetical protein